MPTDRDLANGWVEKVGEVTRFEDYLLHTIKSHTQQREKVLSLAKTLSAVKWTRARAERSTIGSGVPPRRSRSAARKLAVAVSSIFQC
jgi:hypothetical protein